MRNPDVLIQEMESKWKDQKNSGAENFSLKLPNSTANSYNEEFEHMKSEMRKLHAGEKEIFAYRTTLILLFCIRLLCILTAWHGSVMGTILLSSVQFLVAPYSLFVSFGLAIALAPPIYLSHYISFGIIEFSANFCKLMSFHPQ